MGSFESKQSQTRVESSKGWVVQVYNGDRRLLCILEPIHGWFFLMGCGAGLLLAVMWISTTCYRPPVDSMPPVDSPPLQVD